MTNLTCDTQICSDTYVKDLLLSQEKFLTGEIDSGTRYLADAQEGIQNTRLRIDHYKRKRTQVRDHLRVQFGVEL